jgi:hypothetical protein
MPSIAPTRTSRTIKIDKDRQVRFNWSSCCRFEEVYGKTILEAAPHRGIRLITHLAWAGMLPEEPNLTLRETERRLQAFLNQDGNINELFEQIVQALVDSGVLGPVRTDEPTTDESPDPKE